MPIYIYRCLNCLAKEEVLRPMLEMDSPRFHSCGSPMERLVALPQSAIIVETNTDFAYKTLNKEDGHGFPDNKHRERYERHFAQGLNLEKPVIGRGF